MDNLPDEVRGHEIVFKTNIFLVDENGATSVADFYWLYTREDPLAVGFFIQNKDTDEEAMWSIARDTLISCALNGEEAGAGDFRVEVNTKYLLTNMDGSPAEPTLLLHLDGTDEEYVPMHIHGFILRRVTSFFLNKTLRLVPQGTERYDIDGLIDQLLGV